MQIHQMYTNIMHSFILFEPIAFSMLCKKCLVLQILGNGPVIVIDR